MYTIGGICPVCADTMRLERLRCRRCGSALEGSFELSPLFALPPEKLHFVELLVKHRGNIQKVAEEIEVSYRTGRNRMDEIATELGFALPDARPGPDERQVILESIQAGKLTAKQAARLLRGEDE